MSDEQPTTAAATSDAPPDAGADSIAALQASLAAERAALMRLRAAVQAGLPADWADRLRGDSDDDLARDAAQLAARLKPREYGVPPPTTGAPARLDIAAMSPAEVRRHERELLRLARGR